MTGEDGTDQNPLDAGSLDLGHQSLVNVLISLDQNIARVPLPLSDPIYGSSGPLFEHWHTNG